MEALSILFGQPYGIIIGQLILACKYTIYLSLIAFVGGGLFGAFITFLRIIPNKLLNIVLSSNSNSMLSVFIKLDIQVSNLLNL